MVGDAGLDKGLLPLGVVDGVGIELGLQTHTAAEAVGDSVLALLALQEVAAVELDTAAIRLHGHGTAGNGIGKHGAGIGVDFKIVVIAVLQLQGEVILPNIPADGLGGTEVHGRAFHLGQLAGGDGVGIGSGEVTGGHTKDLIQRTLRLVMTGQVEVAVVGHIEHGVLVTDAVVDDLQGAGSFQRVGHMDHRVAGVALVAVGAVKAQLNAALGMADHLPEPVFVAIGAAVEAVFAVVIDGQLIGLAVHGEGCAADTVGIAAHDGAEVGGAGGIFLGGIEAQDHICHIAGSIGYQQLDDGSAVVRNFRGETAAGDGVQVCLLSVGTLAKKLFHSWLSFDVKSIAGIFLVPLYTRQKRFSIFLSHHRKKKQ